MHGLSPVAASGGHSSLRCADLSLQWLLVVCRAQALGVQASAAVACGLSSCAPRAAEHRVSSCDAWAQLLCGTWDLPVLEPVSPTLAGGFPTTAPPGKPLKMLLECHISQGHGISLGGRRTWNSAFPLLASGLFLCPNIWGRGCSRLYFAGRP